MSNTLSKCLPALTECFREYGYEGTSLARITAATGLGKGSLYNAFPEGKDQMLAVVLEEITLWFETQVFAPLQLADEPVAGIMEMFDATSAYFKSGKRACLMGTLSATQCRDRFANHIKSYFFQWQQVLTDTLIRAGWENSQAKFFAEEILASIQGALTLSRALDDPAIFDRTIERLRHRLTE